MPEDKNEVKLCVFGTADSSPLGTMVGGRVLRGSLEVGDVLGRVVIADDVYSVSLQLEEISLYGTLVDELDTGSSANLLVKGDGAERLRCDALLWRS